LKLSFSGRLWHHSDFKKLWLGDSITQFTSQVTNLAVPTIAILLLDATPFQVGVVGTLTFISYPTLGLFVGVLTDRFRRKRIMILTNLLRMITLATVPFSYYIHALSIYQLYLVALSMGICSVFFDISYQAYLPSLVDREDVVEGNQKLQLSASAAQVGGPVMASGLMGLLGAAYAIFIDVFGFLASAVTLTTIKKGEPKPDPPEGGRNFFNEMKEGISVVAKNKMLWTMAGCTATLNLGGNIFNVVLLLYAYRLLHLSQQVIGVPFSIGALGFLIGVLVSNRLTSKLGVGRTIAITALSTSTVIVSLFATLGYPILVLGVAQFFSSLGVAAYNINTVSLRQIITPDRVQGRMNATMRSIIWGTLPLGAFLGGLLGASIGIVSTMIVGVAVSALSFLWIVLGPVIKQKDFPQPAGRVPGSRDLLIYDA
jgi:MFS family permease